MRLLDALRTSGLIGPDGQRIVVNPSAPISAGLVCAFWAGNPDGWNVDLCRNLAPLNVSGVNLAASVTGTTALTNIADEIPYTQLPLSAVDTAQGTVVWFGTNGGSSNTDDHVVSVRSDSTPSSGGYPALFGIRLVGNNTVGSVFNNGDNYQQSTSIVAGSKCYVFAYRAGVSATLYVDGIAVNTGSSSASTAPSTSATFGFGGRASGPATRTTLAMYFKRCLSDAEVLQLSRNPFAPFRAAMPLPMFSAGMVATAVKRPFVTMMG